MCALRGGDPPGERMPIEFKDGTPDEQADNGAAQAHRRWSPSSTTSEQPYLSLRASDVDATHYGDYDHLARVKEWSLTGGAADEEGGE